MAGGSSSRRTVITSAGAKSAPGTWPAARAGAAEAGPPGADATGESPAGPPAAVRGELPLGGQPGAGALAGPARPRQDQLGQAKAPLGVHRPGARGQRGESAG